MIDKLVNSCNERHKKSKCWLCSYKKNCPRDCGRCLHYIHSPDKAPAPRKYDCGKMCDYYVCKYSHKYMSELYYAFACLKDLKDIETLRVLSIGCGPCTDLLAVDVLLQEGEYKCNRVEYKGIEINTKIWKKIHDDLKNISPSNYVIDIIDADVCSYIDELVKENWKPNIIVFQYVFSDMQKHSNEDGIQHLLKAMGEYISGLDDNTYVVCNDINLSRQYNGGREFFDMLLGNINCKVRTSNRHFNNSNRRSHFNYGEEYKNNTLVRSIPTDLFGYEPYNSCSSAQLIIKKVSG